MASKKKRKFSGSINRHFCENIIKIIKIIFKIYHTVKLIYFLIL